MKSLCQKADSTAKMPALAILAVLLAGTFSAFPWGKEGHEEIARAAETMLSNSALAHVQALLGTNDMPAVAVWADEARQLMKYYI
jgi:hypothetical protein